MAHSHQTPKDLFEANRERVKKELAGLDEAIRALETLTARDPGDWSHAASLGYIAETIRELTGGFAAVRLAARRAGAKKGGR